MNARSVVSTLFLLILVISVGYWLLGRPESGPSRPQHVVGGGRESSSATGPGPSSQSSREIQVRVVDAFGVPLEGAVVRPVGSSGASETGPDGFTTVATSSDGQIRIESEHPRWGRVEVEARPSDGRESHEIRYAATAVLEIEIQMRGVEPLNEILVDRLPTETDPETRSIEAKRFDGDTVKSLRVEGVPPGRIEILGFAADGFAFGTARVDVERNGEEHPVVLRITRIDGQRSSDRTIIHGVVSLDGSLMPWEPIKITMVAPGGIQSMDRQTDDSGRYEFEVRGLVHGSKIVGVLTNLFSSVDGVLVPVEVEEAPSELEVDLSFTRRGTISGGLLLVAENGDPLPGVTVEAHCGLLGAEVPLCTNEEGVLALGGLPRVRLEFVAVLQTYRTRDDQTGKSELRVPFELDLRSVDGRERIALPVEVTLLEASIDLAERETIDVEVAYSDRGAQVRTQFRSRHFPLPIVHPTDTGSIEVTGAIVETVRQDRRRFFEPDRVPSVTRRLLRLARPIDCSVPPRISELRPGGPAVAVFVVDAQGLPVRGATLHVDPKRLRDQWQKSDRDAWIHSKAWSFDVIERDRYWFSPDFTSLPETLWIYSSFAGIAELKRDDIVHGMTITLETDRCLVVDTAESSFEYSNFLLWYESGEQVVGSISSRGEGGEFFAPLLPTGAPEFLLLYGSEKKPRDRPSTSVTQVKVMVPPGARRVVAP